MPFGGEAGVYQILSGDFNHAVRVQEVQVGTALHGVRPRVMGFLVVMVTLKCFTCTVSLL